jgi:hypothetical protein
MRQTMAYTVAVVLGIGVVWLGRSQPSESQPVPIESMAPPVQAPLSSTTPRILKFTVSLQSPDDLRVRPGDGVAKWGMCWRIGCRPAPNWRPSGRGRG